MSRGDFGDFENAGRFEEPEISSMRDKLYDATSRIKERAADMTRETRDSAANTLNQTASQVRESSRGMSNETLGKVAATLADGLERTSGYLRPGGAAEMRTDVEGLVRSRPAETIIGALAIGFLVGRRLTRR